MSGVIWRAKRAQDIVSAMSNAFKLAKTSLGRLTSLLL